MINFFVLKRSTYITQPIAMPSFEVTGGKKTQRIHRSAGRQE